MPQKQQTMNTLIRYIWKNRLFPTKVITTTDGKPLSIIATGEENGNIFCNARISIGGETWSGNIVLHDKSSDWEKEIMKIGANAYNNVILHVTLDDDIETMRRNGEYVSQLRLHATTQMEKRYNNINGIPGDHCTEGIQCMSKIKLHSFLSKLLMERIEEKSARIEKLYKECDKRWEDTLFKLLGRNFGFGIQSNLFESWASLLNMQAAGKHRDNFTQIEALFFGQAGLLDESTIPQYYRASAAADKHFEALLREYKFLSSKFNLQTLDGQKWGCGNGNPHQRIARLVSLYCSGRLSMSAIATCNTTEELRTLLQIQPQGYWHTHLQFGGTETPGAPPLRSSQLDLLIINTVIPIMYTFGKHRHDEELCSKAEDFMHTLHSEDNSIIRRWVQRGIEVECAADSQALIQLQKSYCDRHNCSECHIAYEYIRNAMSIEKKK